MRQYHQPSLTNRQRRSYVLVITGKTFTEETDGDVRELRYMRDYSNLTVVVRLVTVVVQGVLQISAKFPSKLTP